MLGAEEIERLRRWRVRPDGVEAIGSVVTARAEAARAAMEEMAEGSRVFAEVVPAEIARIAGFGGFRGGQLKMVVRSAAARYRVEAWVRSGGLAALRGGLRAVGSVVVVVGRGGSA